MKTTANYGLKKPEGNDTVNIDDLNYNADVVDKKIKAVETDITDLKKHVDNGKSSLYSAIVGKKITPRSKDFADLKSAIDGIKLGQGNAQANDVLQGKTFTNDSGVMQIGTMKNYGKTVFTCSENDQSKPNGHYENVFVKGLNSMSEIEIEKIINNTIKNNGKTRTSLANKITENFRKNVPNFTTTKHITVEYEYNQTGWFRQEIPFNTSFNINSCVILIKVVQSGKTSTMVLYSLNDQARKYNHEIKDYISYNKYEYDKILDNDPPIYFRNKQTTRGQTTFLRVMMEEKENTYSEIFYDIYNDKLSMGTTENRARKYKNNFSITFDIFEI